jgi:hypothetical protein
MVRSVVGNEDEALLRQLPRIHSGCVLLHAAAGMRNPNCWVPLAFIGNFLAPIRLATERILGAEFPFRQLGLHVNIPSPIATRDSEQSFEHHVFADQRLRWERSFSPGSSGSFWKSLRFNKLQSFFCQAVPMRKIASHRRIRVLVSEREWDSKRESPSPHSAPAAHCIPCGCCTS